MPNRLGYGITIGYESSLILMFEIDVSPYAYQRLRRIFVYKISTARRAVCTCVYICGYFLCKMILCTMLGNRRKHFGG